MFAAVALVTFVGGGVASAGDKAKKTARGAATTAADAVVDGGRTVGRTTRDFFKHGSHAAKVTAKKEAHKTGHEVRQDARTTRDAAK